VLTVSDGQNQLENWKESSNLIPVQFVRQLVVLAGKRNLRVGHSNLFAFPIWVVAWLGVPFSAHLERIGVTVKSLKIPRVILVIIRMPKAAHLKPFPSFKIEFDEVLNFLWGV
jgi:hypothetical protein